jgi:Cof subfamily protein (haloacid dehalogenase superfamily)
MYKILATDLDGTLLTPEKKVTDMSKEVIEKLVDKGTKVVISTGRIYPAAWYYHRELNLRTPIIACNGAFVIDPIEDKVIFEQTIDMGIAQEIFESAMELDVYCHMYSKNTIYSFKQEKSIKYYGKWTKAFKEEHRINTVFLNESSEIKSLKDKIYKLGISLDCPNSDELIRRIEALDGVKLSKSLSSMADVMYPGVNKGLALEKVCQYYGVPLSQVVAIGDNENDIEMVQKAGYGIVMGSSEAHVKVHGDYVGEDNSSQGFAKSINLLLQEF